MRIPGELELEILLSCDDTLEKEQRKWFLEIGSTLGEGAVNSVEMKD